MICQLCLQDKPLLKKSHIIPDYLKNDLIDNKRRFVEFQLSEKINEKVVQSIFSMENILCQKCDNELLSGLENYFKINLFDPIKKNYSNQIPSLLIHNAIRIKVDYGRVKLFLLSILWRWSLILDCTNVKLGEHQEIIRDMILKDNPGTPDDYPFLIISLINKNTITNDKLVSKVVFSPIQIRENNCFAYEWTFPGLYFRLFISKHNRPEYVKNLYESPDNILVGFVKQGNEKLLVSRFTKGKII